MPIVEFVQLVEVLGVLVIFSGTDLIIKQSYSEYNFYSGLIFIFVLVYIHVHLVRTILINMKLSHLFPLHTCRILSPFLSKGPIIMSGRGLAISFMHP